MLVTTVTSIGVAGAELNPNRTGGVNWAIAPRSSPSQRADAAVTFRAVVTP